MQKFWMVYVEGKGAPSRKHQTKEDAFEEAKRLALQERGRAVILEAVYVAHLVDEPVVIAAVN